MGTRSVNEALEQVASNDNYAYLMIRSSGRLNPLYPCSVIDLPQSYSLFHMTMAFQRDSPITEIFNFFLNQMVRHPSLRSPPSLSFFPPSSRLVICQSSLIVCQKNSPF